MSSEKSSWFAKVQFALIFLSVILVFVLALIGYHQTLEGNDFSFLGAVYSIVCMFMMGGADVQTNNYLLAAQYLAGILFALGIFSLVFSRVKNALMVALIRFTYKDHVIIFSLSTIGQKIAGDLLDKGYKVVIVEQDEENSFIHQLRKSGAKVLIGTGTDGKSLIDSGIATAKTCVIAGDSDQENMEIAQEVLYLKEDKAADGSIKIMLHMSDNDNINILKDYLDIYNEDEDYDLETFNVSQLAARKIYDLYPPHDYLNPEDEDNAIAIVGYNRVAEEFLLENIILSHYPELNNLSIHLFDKEADTCVNQFNFKYPFYKEFIDLQPVNLLNGSFYANFAWSKKEIEKLSKAKVVYMFGSGDSALLTSAANMRQFLYNQTQNLGKVPIVICLPEDAGIMELLNANRDERTNASTVFAKKLHIHQFKLVSDTCTTTGLLEETEMIDRLSKMINYYYSLKYEFESELKTHWEIKNAGELVRELETIMLGLPQEMDKIDERSIQKRLIKYLAEKTGLHYNTLFAKLSVDKRWNILTHRKKDSNRYAARQLSLKFASLKRIGCDPLTTENITRYYTRLAPMEHKRWSAEKMVFNYKYGPLSVDKAEKYILKDILKIHDQLIPYEKLTEVEKEKDLNLFLLLPLLSRIRNN